MCSKPIVLHLMHPDKFTRPLVSWLKNNISEKYEHKFIFLGEEEALNQPNCEFLKLPLKKYFFRNFKLLSTLFNEAGLIVSHGLPVNWVFLFFRGSINKLAWIIYGGTDLEFRSNKLKLFGVPWDLRLKKMVLKRIPFHISHIEGDSKIANRIYESNAEFIYSPVYLSNHTNIDDFVQSVPFTNREINILVGNSTDPSNNHLEVFELLKNIPKGKIKVYCPLSYGLYQEYKEKVKEKGKEIFGDSFFSIENFMTIEEYTNWLKSIDIAIFNHKRQEAMGVTLTLLSLGKTVYMNSQTSSYDSFINRGFSVFDNSLILNPNELFLQRDISNNRNLLEIYYGLNGLKLSWIDISSKAITTIEQN
jgi:hypothetical protein